jgi:hypothetical protein
MQHANVVVLIGLPIMHDPTYANVQTPKVP